MNARSVTDAGFTIVEVMIFLAVSGLMFVLAISAMSGKQQSTEFSTAVDTVRSTLDGYMSEVEDGNYQLPNGQYCQVNAGNSPSFTTTAINPPTSDCTFIGEVIAFNDDNTKTSGSYSVIPVIGRDYQASSSNDASTNISDAQPNTEASLVQTYVMPYQLKVESGDFGSLGIFSFTSFSGENSAGTGLSATAGSDTTSNEDLNSGSSHVELFSLPGAKIRYLGNPTIATIVSDNVGYVQALSSTCPAGYVCTTSGTHKEDINPANGLELCLSSGTSNQSAELTFGGENSNGPTTVTTELFTGTTC